MTEICSPFSTARAVSTKATWALLAVLGPWAPGPHTAPLVANVVVESDEGNNRTLVDSTVATAPVTIVTPSLPKASVGNQYSAPVDAVGGTGIFSWSIADGQLPSGVQLGANGVLNGAPARTGTYDFLVRATSDGQIDERWFTIVVGLRFADRLWIVRNDCGSPGPNCWSNDPQAAWVDSEGQLHLRIRRKNDVWYSAQVWTDEVSSHGKHRFYVIGRLDQLDVNVVGALFLYQDDQHEIDIEFARWGDPALPNTQYVVQPANTADNVTAFEMLLAGTFTTHYMDWQPSSIRFKSIYGHHSEPPSNDLLINEWLYSGPDVPSESDGLRVHINLWLKSGLPPSDGQEVEIVIKSVDLPSRSEG